MGDDTRLAISLSVWLRVEDLRFFVMNTVHGAFLRRRAEWFEPWGGLNYVTWTVPAGRFPTMAEGWNRLRHLSLHGPTAQAFDFQSAAMFRPE